MTVRHILFRFLFPVCATLALLWLVGFGLFVLRVQKFSFPAATVHADALVVLTGGPERVNTGLDLLAAGKADRLFISGVNEKVTVGELIALWRDGRQPPPCCITLGRTARNTAGNAAEAREWVRENDVHSLWLLTADYHLPRALLEFSAALPETSITPWPVLSPTLRDNPSLRLSVLAGEYNKTLLTWLRLRVGGKDGAS